MLLVSSAVVESYSTIGVLLVLSVTLVAGIVLASHIIGPKRPGKVKGSPYESGMPIIGDARRRFNVKFYLVAMIFLLFDVEVIFLWPWAPLFHSAATKPYTIQRRLAVRPMRPCRDTHSCELP